MVSTMERYGEGARSRQTNGEGKVGGARSIVPEVVRKGDIALPSAHRQGIV